jgi:glycerophosphoryl diester phosphodiesterase
MGKPLRIGHRGAAGHVLENTLGSIEKAIELGVDFVEVDVRKTKDGKLIIMHDATVDRTTTGKGTIAAMTLEKVKRLKALDGQTIPTLDEVLALCDKHVGLMLELKAKGVADDIVQVVSASGFSSPVIYASFHHKDLARVRQCLPSATIMPLLSRGPIDLSIPAKLSAHHVGIRFDRVVKPAVESLHTAGVQVFVFTVNDVDDIAHMTDIAVDGIISDMPEAFRARHP